MLKSWGLVLFFMQQYSFIEHLLFARAHAEHGEPCLPGFQIYQGLDTLFDFKKDKSS